MISVNIKTEYKPIYSYLDWNAIAGIENEGSQSGGNQKKKVEFNLLIQ